jgi:heptosyltransferase-3
MRILFIKLRHIGDSLLLTPTIAATKKKYPHAEIWVLVRETCDGILAGCPEIDRILTTANPDSAKRSNLGWLSDLKLAALLRRTHFDFVFELTDNDRARFLALAAWTPNRCVNDHRTLRWFWRPFFHRICTTPRRRQHQVVRDYICPREILQLPDEPPELRFAESRMTSWNESGNFLQTPYCVIHPHTRWARKSWPLENWELLIQGLLEFVPGIVLSCGPDAQEIEVSRRLSEKFGDRVRSTRGRASWSQLAWLLKNASFFAGVDTAAMHLAAACQCPSVVLFGPSPAFEYHPWKTRHWMIRPENWPGEEEAKKFPGEKLMERIPVEKVLAACREAWTRKNENA